MLFFGIKGDPRDAMTSVVLDFCHRTRQSQSEGQDLGNFFHGQDAITDINNPVLYCEAPW